MIAAEHYARAEQLLATIEGDGLDADDSRVLPVAVTALAHSVLAVASEMGVPAQLPHAAAQAAP